MRAIRKRLTYANVVATLALFLALGGGVYAATKIKGSEIKKGTIRGKQIKRASVPGNKLKDASVPGGKLKQETVTGAQVNESTLEVTRIVARPSGDTDLAADGTPRDYPLTGNSWTARPGELDELTGYIEYTTNPACSASGGFVVGGVTFRVGDRIIGEAFINPVEGRIPITGATLLDQPAVEEARTVTARVDADCFGFGGPPVPDSAGTVTAIRAGVIANR